MVVYTPNSHFAVSSALRTFGFHWYAMAYIDSHKGGRANLLKKWEGHGAKALVALGANSVWFVSIRLFKLH